MTMIHKFYSNMVSDDDNKIVDSEAETEVYTDSDDEDFDIDNQNSLPLIRTIGEHQWHAAYEQMFNKNSNSEWVADYFSGNGTGWTFYIQRNRVEIEGELTDEIERVTIFYRDGSIVSEYRQVDTGPFHIQF